MKGTSSLALFWKIKFLNKLVCSQVSLWLIIYFLSSGYPFSLSPSSLFSDPLTCVDFSLPSVSTPPLHLWFVFLSHLPSVGPFLSFWHVSALSAMHCTLENWHLTVYYTNLFIYLVCIRMCMCHGMLWIREQLVAIVSFDRVDPWA